LQRAAPKVDYALAVTAGLFGDCNDVTLRAADRARRPEDRSGTRACLGQQRPLRQRAHQSRCTQKPQLATSSRKHAQKLLKPIRTDPDFSAAFQVPARILDCNHY